jgi:ATP-dependent Zn protease|tara:strand:- start:1888 stop:2217 length:330 start_codon:yes stop_codon:yes gene_type:complete
MNLDEEYLLEKIIANEAGKKTHLKIIEEMKNNNNDDIKDKKNEKSIVYWIVIIFILLWLLIGILGWFFSIYCFKYNKNKEKNIIGLLIATIFGPFYWLYYLYIDNYCGK